MGWLGPFQKAWQRIAPRREPPQERFWARLAQAHTQVPVADLQAWIQALPQDDPQHARWLNGALWAAMEQPLALPLVECLLNAGASATAYDPRASRKLVPTYPHGAPLGWQIAQWWAGDRHAYNPSMIELLCAHGASFERVSTHASALAGRASGLPPYPVAELRMFVSLGLSFANNADALVWMSPYLEQLQWGALEHKEAALEALHFLVSQGANPNATHSDMPSLAERVMRMYQCRYGPAPSMDVSTALTHLAALGVDLSQRLPSGERLLHCTWTLPERGYRSGERSACAYFSSDDWAALVRMCPEALDEPFPGSIDTPLWNLRRAAEAAMLEHGTRDDEQYPAIARYHAVLRAQAAAALETVMQTAQEARASTATPLQRARL